MLSKVDKPGTQIYTGQVGTTQLPADFHDVAGEARAEQQRMEDSNPELSGSGATVAGSNRNFMVNANGGDPAVPVKLYDASSNNAMQY